MSGEIIVVEKWSCNSVFKKNRTTSNKKIESLDSYCYSKIIWNTEDNLIILISYTKDYFEQVIEIQDAINKLKSINDQYNVIGFYWYNVPFLHML